MSDQRGLYDKYKIPQGSFLLKPEGDHAARTALRAYANTTDNKQLSADLIEWMNKLDGQTMSESRTCTECGEYARYRVTWLLPNARTNPASSGYLGDDISYCANRTTDRCEEHKSDYQFPVPGYEWCSTRDMEWSQKKDKNE